MEIPHTLRMRLVTLVSLRDYSLFPQFQACFPLQGIVASEGPDYQVFAISSDWLIG